MADSTPAQEEFSEIFDMNGFVSAAYPLFWLNKTRRRLLGRNIPEWWDTYAGEALTVGSPGTAHSKTFIIPPNMAGLVLLASGKCRTLGPGRHRISKKLDYQPPVSVQFVDMRMRSLRFDDLVVRAKDHLDLELNVVMEVQVEWREVQSQDGAAQIEYPGALRIAQWDDPVAALSNKLKQELMEELSHYTYDQAVDALPEIVSLKVHKRMTEFCLTHGLRLDALHLPHFHPNKNRHELEVRGANVDLYSEIERRAAQAEEDIVALKQPAGRRKIAGELAGQARERNQAARMEAIEAVSDMAKALMEEMHKHPGRMYGQQDMQPLMKALELLEKLTFSEDYNPPKVPQQVRSFFAVDVDPQQPPPRAAVPPPVHLPDKPLPVPPNSIWDDQPKASEAPKAP